MPKFPPLGHGPAFMIQAPTATTAPPPPAEAQGGSLEKVQKINLDLIKPKIYRSSSGQELKLREVAKVRMQKIEKKADPKPCKSGSAVNLNWKVEVTPSAEAPQEDREAVVCRHFATEFALHRGKKAELMTQFSTPEGIEAKFDGRLRDLDTARIAMVREAPQDCKHVVNSDHFGSYLTALAATLNEPGRPKEANCLLLTHDHAMALHVERKCKDGVDYFSAKLYDPNDTGTFKRVERPNAEALGSLTLEDMLISRGEFSHYAGEGNTSLSMVAVSLDHDLQPQMDRSDTTHSANNVGLALRFGVHTELQSMLHPLPQKPEEALNLLQAKTFGSADSGAYYAWSDGHAEAVEVFTQAVLKSNLDEKVKAELLAAKCRDGCPGLHWAFYEGETETVKAFTQAVLDSDLNENLKVELLAAKNGDSGLASAFRNGCTETVEAFTQAVLKSNLKESLKAELLAATNSDGLPGLRVAFHTGDTETVKAFTQAVLDSDLNENLKVELLAAKNGDSGLASAFRNGFIETVEAFTQAVLKSNLKESLKAELLELPSKPSHLNK